MGSGRIFLQDSLEPDLVIFGSLSASSARKEELLQRMGRQRLEMNLVLGNAVINRDLPYRDLLEMCWSGDVR